MSAIKEEVDIRTMEAGQEINALVAQHLFNLALYRYPYADLIVLERTRDGSTRLPEYSTDRNDVEEVLVKVREWDAPHQADFLLRLKWAIEDRTGESCTDRAMILYAKPVDICRAVLKATEKQ